MADRGTLHLARVVVARERQEARLLAPPEAHFIPPETSGPRASVTLLAFIVGLITGVAGVFATMLLSAS
jgi:hypothetical protein